jgi:formate hydrogenlyase subunit 3/multisubunit Na+/H+ antiporter MnhD subunit
LAAGNILHVLGHDRIPELAGTARRMPLTFYVFGVAGVSIMGLPPSSAFLAKWLFLEASLKSGQWWWIVVILAGSLLAAVYTFRVVKYAFAMNATPAPAITDHPALPSGMEVVPMLLAFCGLILGFAGTPLLALLDIGSPFAGGRP